MDATVSCAFWVLFKNCRVSGFLLSMTLVEYNIYVCLYVWLYVMCVYESVVGRCTSTDKYTERREKIWGEKKKVGGWEETFLLIDLSVHKCFSSLLEIGISRRQYQRQRAWRACCLCSLVFYSSTDLSFAPSVCGLQTWKSTKLPKSSLTCNGLAGLSRESGLVAHGQMASVTGYRRQQMMMMIFRLNLGRAISLKTKTTTTI